MSSSGPNQPCPFLSLRAATFRLGDQLVFESTSWILHRHEQWAIVGENGSGKSLFADALRGRLPLVEGELRYHFRPPTGFTAEDLISHVSFEDQKPDLHNAVGQSRWNTFDEETSLLVADFLSYERVMDINPFELTGRHDRLRPAFERRKRRVAAILCIEPFLDRTLISLSSGEAQRVQLARALCHPSRLLILDEPFMGLDAATRRHFRRVLERLIRTPLRMLLITTRPEDLPSKVTHVLCVKGCRVVAAGPRDLLLPLPGQKGRKKERSAGQPEGRKRGQNLGAAVRGTISSSSDVPELVKLCKVTVRYGKATLLHDVSWTVRVGESWALLGPNGSGKTTLLSLILGDNPQVYRNRVVVFGKPRGSGESIWEIKRHIGWVSPELHLHFDGSATCFEVVASRFHDTIGLFEPISTKQRASARQRLEQLKLLQFADAPLSVLSAGMQRMVLLGRALAKNPRLLVLDEPCQGLDPAHREVLIGTVDALIRAGSVTAIYVTHRDDEIPPSIERVLRLSGGKGEAAWRQPNCAGGDSTKKPAGSGCGQNKSRGRPMRRCRR